MKVFVKEPEISTINSFLSMQHRRPFSYREVGYSRLGSPPGYTVDHHRKQLGEGDALFDSACRALRRWEMFQISWVTLCWPDAPIEPGREVAVLIYSYGLFLLNACRIIYVINESAPIRRFGFAYGTLPDHGESGEERFTVELHPDGSVWYDVFAFSRPANWLVRLGSPIARRLQRQFARGSLGAMEWAVQETSRETRDNLSPFISP